MKKEHIAIAAQLLTTMRDIAVQLAEAQNHKNLEKARALKQELLHFQSQLDHLL